MTFLGCDDSFRENWNDFGESMGGIASVLFLVVYLLGRRMG